MDISPAELYGNSVALMPPGLGEVYTDFHNDVSWLHLKWRHFCHIYGTDPKTVDLVNAVAPSFFRMLQDLMWNDVLLGICRLTDNVKSMGKQNLTLLRIPELIPETEAGFRAEVEALVTSAKDKAAFARDWRNRKLAHRELPPPIGAASRPLADASRFTTDEAITAIRSVMNRIEVRYQGSPVMYQLAVEPLGGVESLLTALRKVSRQ